MLQNLSRLIDYILGACMALFLAGMSCLVFSNVVLRYMFNSGITWSEEMSRYSFVFMVFFGIASAMKSNLHLSADFIVEMLPAPLRALLQLISGALMLYLMYLLIDGGWKLALINANAKGPVTGMPLWLLYVSCMAVGVFISICILFTLWRLVRNGAEAGPATAGVEDK